MYIVQEIKNGDTYDMVTQRCKYCLGNEFYLREEKAYCSNCHKEYKETLE